MAFKVWTEETIDEIAEKMMSFFKDNPKAFTLESFCAEHGLYPQRLSEWAKTNENIAEAIKVCKNICASRMAQRTADSDMPPAFGIFGMKQHGWSDKQEIEHSGSVGITSLAQALQDA